MLNISVLFTIKKKKAGVGVGDTQKKEMQHTISFRHDQFIQRIQISLGKVYRGREFGIIMSLEAITLSTANCLG